MYNKGKFTPYPLPDHISRGRYRITNNPVYWPPYYVVVPRYVAKQLLYQPIFQETILETNHIKIYAVYLN